MGNFFKGVGKAVQEVDMALHGIKPHSNEAINKILTNKAVSTATNILDKPINMLGASGGVEGGVAGRLQQIADGKLAYGTKDYVRMGLGTYAAASIAGRAVSGGGVYKDSRGNFDVAGIPII